VHESAPAPGARLRITPAGAPATMASRIEPDAHGRVETSATLHPNPGIGQRL
jgi:hypothetical protein